jgi:hypothetical protein
MKARLVPLYFDPGRDADFDRQLAALQGLFADSAEWLKPRPLGAEIPDAEAVIFPQLLGEAYRRLPAFKSLRLPILLVTSHFGTLSMWDWEIAAYLRSEGVETIGPYNLDQTRTIVAALGVKRELRETKFLVYQDDPGEGFQAPIFKRFYWWEDECIERMRQKFGFSIVKNSFRELGARAKALPDDLADTAWRTWDVPADGLSDHARRAAAKVCLAVAEDLDRDPSIRAAGINCLNESQFSESSPCLAWNVLYQQRGLIWGCEADALAMVTKYILHKSLGAPIMMTNIYPFLLGNAALAHERIESFPSVDAEPENHLLVAHCGYMGVIPQPMATEWTLRKKVLAIVDENASAIDARLPVGDITLAKLLPTMDRLSMTEGRLTGYAQFPGSDCLNGGVIKVRDGRKLMERLVSHHYLLLVGRHAVDLGFVGQVFGIALEDLCPMAAVGGPT